MTDMESLPVSRSCSPPTVSVVIATRNRKEECLLAIRSALNQTCIVSEIVVYDDASDVPMSPYLAEFEGRVRSIRFDTPRGATGCRQHAIEICPYDYILMIDDDCWLSSREILTSAVRAMLSHPAWGAVGLPLVEPRRLPEGHSAFNAAVQSIGREKLELCSFFGGSVLFRVAALHQIGGVRAAFQMLGGDEADVAWRLQAAGWGIGYANCEPIVHTVSPSRDSRSKFYYDARSALLCDVLNHPFPDVIGSFTRHSIQLFFYKFTFRTLVIRISGIGAGWWAAIRNIGQRSPVPHVIFRRCRTLPRHGVEFCPEHLRSDCAAFDGSQFPQLSNRDTESVRAHRHV